MSEKQQTQIKNYLSEDHKLLQAIDCIIKDVDKKYDECLVEHFLEYLKARCQIRDDVRASVMDRLKSYFDHEAFTMMNQARAYKTLHSIILMEFVRNSTPSSLISFMDSFWSTVGGVILSNNLSAVTVLFSIFQQLIQSRRGLEWMFGIKLKPVLEVSSSLGTDEVTKILSTIVDIITFYIENCNNYHTRSKAESILVSLFELDAKNSPNIHNLLNRDSFFRQVRDEVVRHILRNNSGILIYITNLLSEASQKLSDYLENMPIEISVKDSLLINPVKANFKPDNLCKCLAALHYNQYAFAKGKDIRMSTFLNEYDIIMNQNGLTAALIYLSSLRLDRSYVLRTILYCISQDSKSKSIEQEVKIYYQTYPDRKKISKNMINNDVISTSIRILADFIQGRKCPNISCILDEDEFKLVRSIMIDYILTHYTVPVKSKNVRECCRILNNILDNSCPNIYEFKESVKQIIYAILNLDINNAGSKPVLMSLLGACKSGFEAYSPVPEIFDLIRKQTHDHDVLNEFVLIFNDHTSKHIKKSEFDRNVAASVGEFFLQNLYPHIGEAKHPDLEGNFYEVLFKITSLVSDIDVDHYIPSETIQHMKKLYHNRSHESEKSVKFYNEGRLINSTIADEIINFESISDGIVDCY